MTTYFADYRWSKGYPKGLAAIDDPNGEAHFRLLEVDGGCRLEQYDAAGKFVRLIHCPQDQQVSGTAYETSEDGLHKVRRSADGAVPDQSISAEEFDDGGGDPPGEVVH